MQLVNLRENVSTLKGVRRADEVTELLVDLNFAHIHLRSLQKSGLLQEKHLRLHKSMAAFSSSFFPVGFPTSDAFTTSTAG